MQENSEPKPDLSENLSENDLVQLVRYLSYLQNVNIREVLKKLHELETEGVIDTETAKEIFIIAAGASGQIVDVVAEEIFGWDKGYSDAVLGGPIVNNFASGVPHLETVSNPNDENEVFLISDDGKLVFTLDIRQLREE